MLALSCLLFTASCKKEEEKKVGAFPVQPTTEDVTRFDEEALSVLTHKVKDPSVVRPDEIEIDAFEDFGLSDADKEKSVQRAIISAYADWCGFDWSEKSFMPYMVREYPYGALSDQQMNHFTLIHRRAMNSYRADLDHKEPCSEKDKKTLAPFLYEELVPEPSIPQP